MQPSSRFLLAGAAAAASTANAVRPVLSGPASMASFAFGVAPSELPIQAGLVELGTAALLARRGGAKGWRGALGLAAHAASLAGLAYVHRQAGQAVGILEAALVDELGANYRGRIDASLAPTTEWTLSRTQLLLPDMRLRQRYRHARDVKYGEFGRKNHLDVWKRADLPTDAKAPVLLQFHGSAWSVARKENQAEPLMAHLAERGWVCVTANYRLSPRATWPDHIVDAKRALAWVKENIAAHGGDPDFVVITGGSAGGHLASLAALTPNLADFQPGFEDADTSVAACVSFYGVYDFVNRHGTSRADMEKFVGDVVFKSKLDDDRARWEQASTISHVGPHAPPFFVIHGTNDSLVPVAQARTFVGELRKESTQPVVYAELPGAQHAFDVLPSVRTHACAQAVDRFLAVVRSEYVAAKSAGDRT
ncbi:MAG TPA: alpha/beta hydrolase [Acidimicrobiales bacterium]|nr:alpha/beta hydrolase [Acidimicrobiales bacterium]